MTHDCKDGRVDFFKKALIAFGKKRQPSRTPMEEIELSSLDLRYEDYRLKSPLAVLSPLMYGACWNTASCRLFMSGHLKAGLLSACPGTIPIHSMRQRT